MGALVVVDEGLEAAPSEKVAKQETTKHEVNMGVRIMSRYSTVIMYPPTFILV